jgi:hypothetical protein
VHLASGREVHPLWHMVVIFILMGVKYGVNGHFEKLKISRKAYSNLFVEISEFSSTHEVRRR